MVYGPGDYQHRLFEYLKRMDDQRPAIILDEIAAQMSKALSDTTTAGTPTTSGTSTGFQVDIGGLSNGNTIQVSYTDALNVQHNITIVRVDDPSALPLSIERLNAWAKAVEARGILLVPLTTVMTKSKSS